MANLTLSSASHRNLSDILAGKTLKYGFIWALASSLLIQLVYSYYLISSTPDGNMMLWLFLPQLLLSVALYAFITGLINNKRQKVAWFCSTLLISLCWIITAYDVLTVWQERAAAEKILLIGFFSLLLAWYSRLGLMLLSQLVLLAGYSYLMISDPFLGDIDQFLAIVKLPLLVLLLIVTLRRQYLYSLKLQTENERLIDSLRAMSYTDELTGLSNRKGFNQALMDELHHTDRFHTPLSLLIVDVDYFKQFNDSQGHPAGDMCLREIARVLSEQAQRAVDTVARIGGEEFALILPGSNCKQAVQLSGMIMQALSELAMAHPQSEISDHVTVSIGIASYKDDDEESFYHKADQALYRAKQGGRNRYEIYSLLETAE